MHKGFLKYAQITMKLSDHNVQSTFHTADLIHIWIRILIRFRSRDHIAESEF